MGPLSCFSEQELKSLGKSSYSTADIFDAHYRRVELNDGSFECQCCHYKGNGVGSTLYEYIQFEEFIVMYLLLYGYDSDKKKGFKISTKHIDLSEQLQVKVISDVGLETKYTYSLQCVIFHVGISGRLYLYVCSS
jgi:hypothetical protein